MSIPKIIHYCWFGYNEKPDLAEKCMNSWRRCCPDYQIIEWNESNINISSCPQYVQDAYSQGLYAFVSDYVRLQVVYDNGGVYLDTDVELTKPLDTFLQHNAFFGFEDGIHIATGLGFGAIPQFPLLKEMMRDYYEISFFHPDGSINYTTNTKVNTHVFLPYGLKQNNKKQVLEEDILILPTDYMCPIDYHTDKLKKIRHTVSIHWFAKSWMSENSIIAHEQRKKELYIDFWLHLPNRLLLRMLGKNRYEKLKSFFHH